ncbi:hypothetical protein Zmor_008502 [Zophobas morio]|uniref:Uncharacterized protein n=1 Tax=Zophobas morio TaxID=2755281 RepID=A0AA38J007_9CUCU|nr:hypothetical protein Zmor_008502 [Zophobas morio]
MNKLSNFFVLAALLAAALAVPAAEYQYDPEETHLLHPPTKPIGQIYRIRRSPQGEWVFKPNFGRDADGNTGGVIELERQGDDNEFRAVYSKPTDGGRETWNVGGTFKF